MASIGGRNATVRVFPFNVVWHRGVDQLCADGRPLFDK